MSSSNSAVAEPAAPNNREATANQGAASAYPRGASSSISGKRRLVSAKNTQPAGPGVVQFRLDQSWKTGLHLIDSSTESLIMGRDGWLHTVAKQDRETSMRSSSERFRVASVTEMRNQLRSEFGRKFDVIATNNFLVVQPKGRGDRWPKMFEQSHRSFVDFMSKRGVNVREGRFPMVAVVLPDARAMYSEFERLGLDVSRVAGLYANRCNRVMTHDGGRLSDIVATVRHEAAHQSAFNSGVHSRVNDTPSWITEGIGQMFEPAALSGGLSGSRVSDRVNRESVDFLRKNIPLSDANELHGLVQQLIRGDEMFRNQSSIHTAYSLGWAMMFYLSERQPGQFADILNFTATRPPFQNYRAGQRQIDFERVMGMDSLTFTNRLARFISSLP